MIVDSLPHLVSGLTDFNLLDGQLLLHLLADTPQVDADLWGDVQKAWSNFTETGQVWAFLTGIVFGWMIRSILP